MSLAPLMGLPGRIKILLDRIGSSTPTQLGRLDTNVLSRAPASTALSSSTWTPTKAGYLNASITSRASQASVDALPQGIVESVQRGTVTSSATAPVDVTISAVDLSKAIVIVEYRFDGTSSQPRFAVTGKLTSSTNLRLSRYSGTILEYTVEWQVIEYV